MRKAMLFAVLATAIGCPAAAQEQDLPAYRDFTFKREKARSPGVRGGLVQIDPDATPFALTPKNWTRDKSQDAAGRPTQDGGGAGGQSAWFWDVVSPALGAGADARATLAIAHLTASPAASAVPAPSFDAMQSLVRRFGALVEAATEGTRVSPALVLATMSAESAGRIDAVSSAGAGGLMQLMPATADRFGVTDRMDPAQNINGGVIYLDWLLDRFGGDALLALAAYNAGEGAVDTHAGVPPYSETRAYVPKVLNAWRVARTQCVTAPNRLSDPCRLRIPLDVTRAETALD